MPTQNVTFTIAGTAYTFDEKEMTAQARWFSWVRGYTPGKLLLNVRVKQKTAGTTPVSVLIIELSKASGTQNQYETDVFYEFLMDPRNLNKDFTIQDLRVGEGKLEVKGHSVTIPRDAYHNIIPPVEVGTPLIDNYTRPSDADIDNADDATFNNYVRDYNRIRLNYHVIREFKRLTDEANSTGIYWQFDKEKNWNNYYNTHVSEDVKKGYNGLTEAWEIGSPGVPTTKTKQSFKDDLKRFWAQFEKTVNAQIPELNKLRQQISDWRAAGNLTDPEHNEAVKEWKNKVKDSEEVKKYKELEGKVNGSDPKYSKHKGKFDEESKKSVDGVSANEDLETIATPHLNEIPESDFFSDTAHASKTKIKNDFRDFRKTAEKVLARKKAVVDLIEGLVASDTGGNGSKLTCPNCNQKFDALSFEYNGKKYHSQQCADEAKQKEKDQGGGGPDQNQGIDQTRTAAIQDINNALGEDPKIATSDLDSDFQNWETQIKQLNTEKDINDLRDKVLINIKRKRKEKQTEKQINEAGEGIDEATGQDLINKIKKNWNSWGCKNLRGAMKRYHWPEHWPSFPRERRKYQRVD